MIYVHNVGFHWNIEMKIILWPVAVQICLNSLIPTWRSVLLDCSEVFILFFFPNIIQERSWGHSCILTMHCGISTIDDTEKDGCTFNHITRTTAINIVDHANMNKVRKSFLPTKLDLFKASSSYNSVRNNVYHAKRIVVKCVIGHRQ